MYYFKYFRNDTNFAKSIRYNELYFAANNSLNDPMDLSFNPIFWDNIDYWKQFIGSYDNGLVALMHYISPPKNDEFYVSINNLFKGHSLKEIEKSYDLFHRKTMDVISEHDLATGIDINSAAALLMDKFMQIIKNNNFLSVSFSKTPFNYLMWSHYANGFKGCILIYDFKKNKSKLKTHILGNDYEDVKMQNVQYSNHAKHPDLWTLISKNQIDNSNYFFTKNKKWKYEKESRLVLLSPHASSGEILHHDSSLVIGVIFGSRCDNEFKAQTIRALKENRANSNVDEFLSFNSILNEESEIEIKSGTKHTITKVFDLPLTSSEIIDWNKKFSRKRNIKEV